MRRPRRERIPNSFAFRYVITCPFPIALMVNVTAATAAAAHRFYLLELIFIIKNKIVNFGFVDFSGRMNDDDDDAVETSQSFVRVRRSIWRE